MSYKRVKDHSMKLFGNSKKYDEQSDSSFSESVSEIDIFGVEDGGQVSRKKTTPVKGFKYLFFCIFMIAVLSGMVIMNQGTHVAKKDDDKKIDYDTNKGDDINDHKDTPSKPKKEDEEDDKKDDKNKKDKAKKDDVSDKVKDKKDEDKSEDKKDKKPEDDKDSKKKDDKEDKKQDKEKKKAEDKDDDKDSKKKEEDDKKEKKKDD